jgi:CheY-like chemotaxis protein
MAYSAESALALAGEFVPDIILLTTDLPDQASYHVAAALRWRSSQSTPRLIAITGDIVTNDRHRALAVGFEQYLTAPVERDALESVLRRRAARLLPISSGSHNASN